MNFIVAPIASVMSQAMEWFYRVTGSYPAAIVLLTVALRVLIAPLFVYQMKSMKKMQELQPQIKALQERYKGEPERLNREIMELYRKNNANPLAGCLPLFIQMPFLFAIFKVLAEKQFPPGSELFGVIPLNHPDPTYILPILSGLVTFAQSWLSGMVQDANQRVMAFVMPVLIAWFGTKYAAGIALYWLVSTVVGLVQQAIYPGFRPRGSQGEAAAR